MDEKATCEVCGALAVWQWAPADSFGDYCDDHVPRGCSCNAVDFEDPSGPQHLDEWGRLRPCVEIEFDADGFPPKVQRPVIMRKE